MVVDKLAIARIFNNYFASVFPTDDGNSPEYTQRALGVPDIQGSQEGVLEVLLNLNAKKTHGADNNIPNMFVSKKVR